MTDPNGTAASTAAMKALNAETTSRRLDVSRELLEQIYSIEERYQFDRDRHEAPGKVRDAIAVELARLAAGLKP
jgi:hypothetical protein